jgi:predicted O-methyltransferase YrrM
MVASTRVAEAEKRAIRAGFTRSSDPGVGELLAVLACAVRPGGRVLEIGTGVGVGLAWIVEGLTGRADVEVVSVELDPGTAEVAAAASWPDFVRLRVGDILALYDEVGRFDLIFADAQGGKWEGLDRTIAALAPGGVLLVDDMTVGETAAEPLRAGIARVRNGLLSSTDLTAVEIGWSSGLILCTRRR